MRRLAGIDRTGLTVEPGLIDKLFERNQEDLRARSTMKLTPKRKKRAEKRKKHMRKMAQASKRRNR